MTFMIGQMMAATKGRIWPDFTFPREPTVIQEGETSYIPSELDGNMAWGLYKGLTIEEGAVLTPENRCKGLTILVKGDLVLDGVISMTARGCAAPGDDISIDYKTGNVLLNPADFGTYEYEISATGGTGGARLSYTSGTGRVSGLPGAAATGFACGGGGGGAILRWTSTARSGSGGTATSYSGGPGGGSASSGGSGYAAYATNASNAGGAGGSGSARNASGTGQTYRAAGGTGNPGGTGLYNAYDGFEGTGGLLIVMVYGNVIIGENGVIQSDGSDGRDRAYAYSNPYAGPGGSGGGSIHLLHTGRFTNNGTIQANGGRGGDEIPTHGGAGGAGGAGTIRVAKVRV